MRNSLPDIETCKSEVKRVARKNAATVCALPEMRIYGRVVNNGIARERRLVSLT